MKSEQIHSWHHVEFKELIKNRPRHGIYKPKEFLGKGIQLIKMDTITNYDQITDNDIPYLLELTDNEMKRFQTYENDLIFLRTSLVFEGTGKCSILSDIKNPTTFVSNIIAVTLDTSKTVPDFYYYYFKSQIGRQNILSICEQTAASTLRSSDLITLKVPVPPLSIQTKISKILSSLESLILLLKQQNKILEKITHIIFQSWFVNFDGVTEFEDSELGQIPKGWKVDKINNVCKTFGGGTPSTKNPDYWNGNIGWIVPRDLTSSEKLFCVDSERKITNEGLQNCSSELHPINSIFMTSRATIGEFTINKIPLATNQGFIVIRPPSESHLYYLYLNFFNRINEFINHANGSTFLEISRKNFRELPILIPTNEKLEEFHQKIKQFFEIRFNNEQVLDVLIKTRNILLPKLMSGEIRV